MLNGSKFPEYSTVHSQNSLSALQGTDVTPPLMLLVTPEFLVMPWVIYLGKHHQISCKITNLGSLSKMVTHQTLYSSM